MDERIDNRLHRYFDGDLTPGEAAELRERIDHDPALSSKMDALREVRGVVRESVARAALDIPSEDLWAKIEAEIGGATITAPTEASTGVPSTSVPSTVVPSITSQSAMTSPRSPEPLAERARESSDAPPAKRPALRVVEGGRVPAAVAPDASRRRVTTIVIAGLAIAAAVLLLVLRPGEPPAPGGSAPLAQLDDSGDPATPEALEPTTEEIVSRTEVLEVDFGDNSGAIFAVEGDDGEQYAVVWLADVQPKQTAVE